MILTPPARRWRGDCPQPASNPPGLALAVPDELVQEIARRAALLAVDLLTERDDEPADGYLPLAKAAASLGVSRQRIHQLTSSRTLQPDGRDGRTPLYTRASLDRYVHSCASGRRGR